LCLVNAHYGPGTAGWGATSFNSIAAAQVGCPFDPAIIALVHSNATLRDSGGNTIHTENVVMGHTTRQLRIKTYRPYSTSAASSSGHVVVKGCHTVNALSNGLLLADMGLEPTPGCPYALRTTSAPTGNFSFSAHSVFVSAANTTNSSALSLQLRPGTHAVLDGLTVIGTEVGARLAPMIKIEFIACGVTNIVSVNDCTAPLSVHPFLEVTHATSLSITRNTVASCGPSGKWCVRTSKCSAETPLPYLSSNKVTGVSSIGSVGPTFYTGISLHFETQTGYDQGSETSLATALGYITGNVVTAVPVAIRVSGLHMGFLCQTTNTTGCTDPSRDTSRYNARRLSEHNSGSSSTFQDIVLEKTNDTLLASRLAEWKAYHCTAQCPIPTTDEMLQVGLITMVSVLVLFALWCVGYGGVTVFTRHIKNMMGQSEYMREKRRRGENLTTMKLKQKNTPILRSSINARRRSE
jgi:hypothetical protein